MPDKVTPLADAETIRDTARKVLEDPDYRMRSTETFGSIVEWLLDLLKPLYDFFDMLYDVSPILFFLVVAFMVVLVAALLVHIFYSFKTAMQRRARAALFKEMDDESVNLPETWERRAVDAMEANEYLHAIRFIMHATLLRLEQARKAKLRRGATNREYLRRYTRTAAYEPLAELVDITDSRWFGGVTCTRADVDACFRANQKIQALLTVGDNNDQHA